MVKITRNSKLYRKAIYGVAAILLLGVVVLSVHYISTAYIPNTERKSRIEAIYANLQLDSSYVPTGSDVFGEKRVYSWDTGRTYSSTKKYQHDANVDTTVAELKSKIETAGFAYFDEPYPGSGSVQYHFKSGDGEYIRLTVSSQAYDNAAYDGNDATLPYETDANTGPSNVIVKVNLDDNNE